MDPLEETLDDLASEWVMAVEEEEILICGKCLVLTILILCYANHSERLSWLFSEPPIKCNA